LFISLKLKMSKCINCNRENITTDEIGLNKKFINRDVTEYLCIDCLAKKYACSKESLIDLIHLMKKLGCGLFKKGE